MIDESSKRKIRMVFENSISSESMVSPEEFFSDPLTILLSLAETVLKSKGPIDSKQVLNILTVLTQGCNPFDLEDLENTAIDPRAWYKALAAYLNVPLAQIMPLALQFQQK